MAGGKIAVQLDYNSNVDSLLNDIGKLTSGEDKPDLIFVKMSSQWFPKRLLDLPSELRNLFARNPTVKPLWSGTKFSIPVEYLDDGYEVPDVSFIVPFYNGSEYIGRCLDSIIT